MKCYKCGGEFVPDKEKIKAWAESNRQFEPTDWECGECDKDPDLEEFFDTLEDQFDALMGDE